MVINIQRTHDSSKCIVNIVHRLGNIMLPSSSRDISAIRSFNQPLNARTLFPRSYTHLLPNPSIPLGAA